MRRHQVQKPQDCRLWLWLLPRWASVYLRLVSFLSFSRGHSKDKVFWKGRHLESRLHPCRTLYRGAYLPWQQWVGAAWVDYGTLWHASWEYDWQEQEEGLLLWHGLFSLPHWRWLARYSSYSKLQTSTRSYSQRRERVLGLRVEVPGHWSRDEVLCKWGNWTSLGEGWLLG